MEKHGLLTIGTMPIGDHKDLTQNLIYNLISNDIIYVETMWVIKEIGNKLGIDFEKKSIVLDRDDKKQSEIIVSELKNGKNIIFVSDGGSAFISDPGLNIISHPYFKKNNYKVLPGPSSIALAFDYAASNGIISDNEFHFYGFYTKESIKKIKDRKDEVAIIFLRSYEQPSDQEDLDYKSIFKYMYDQLGEKSITICIDLTTEWEKIIKTNLSNAYDKINDHIQYGKENFVKEKIHYYLTLVIADSSKNELD